MEKKRTKQEIVKMLLNQNLETENEDELIELLIDIYDIILCRS